MRFSSCFFVHTLYTVTLKVAFGANDAGNETKRNERIAKSHKTTEPRAFLPKHSSGVVSRWMDKARGRWRTVTHAHARCHAHVPIECTEAELHRRDWVSAEVVCSLMMFGARTGAEKSGGFTVEF